jgi:hypothetical protein
MFKEQYRFFTETNCNTTFSVLGKPIQFRQGYWGTNDPLLARAVEEKCAQWDVVASNPLKTLGSDELAELIAAAGIAPDDPKPAPEPGPPPPPAYLPKRRGRPPREDEE